MRLLLVATLLVATPLWAQEQVTETHRGNLFNLKKVEDGTYVLEVLNGFTPGPLIGSSEHELTLDGFTVKFVYTYIQNYRNGNKYDPLPPEEAADMVDVLDVPVGWMAFPSYQSVPEDGLAVIKIVRDNIS